MAKRKISIFLALYFIILGSILCGCDVLSDQGNGDSNNSRGNYKLTVQDPYGYIIANLADRYDEGEEVTVKTKVLPGMYLVAYLDEVQVKLKTQKYEKDACQWEYSFTMPSHDAVLSFSLIDDLTKDGIVLDEDTQKEIILSFVSVHSNDRYPVTEDEISLRCYGAFEDVYALFVYVSSWGVATSIWTEVVAGVNFTYTDGWSMVVYRNNEFYSISEAYENNVLSYDNLLTIQQNYTASHSV